MLDPYDITKKDIGFTWVDQFGITRTWITSRMQRYADDGHVERVVTEIDLDYAKFVKANNGIETHRLHRLTPQIIANSPVLYITLPNGTHKLVDGNHRYLRAAQLGWREIQAYVFTVEQADMFEVRLDHRMQDFLRGTMDWHSGIA